MEKLIFNYNTEPNNYTNCKDIDPSKYIDSKYLINAPVGLPNVSEREVSTHYTKLSKKAYGVDDGIYPLGSCTMKYNPKINEDISNNESFTSINPYVEEDLCQGILKILFETENYLKEISGMDAVTLSPAAGAHGELTGLFIIDSYHKSNGNDNKKRIIVPDSSHGTNPASAAMFGLEIVEIKSNEAGNIDINALKKVLNDDTAALMLTNPNTLGFFEKDIVEIARLVHSYGALLYYDGANLNALMGYARPGDMGFDVMHFNLHKTFSTPHGAGGPGAGPVAVKENLRDFLPNPKIEFIDNKYTIKNHPNSIGKIRSFYGPLPVIIKAYSYILSLGGEGLKNVSKIAVLNSNYLLSKLKKHFEYPFGDKICMHEFVLSANSLNKEFGIKALNIAKRLIDYNIHPPTIYFPLIVKEAMMFEVTETESLGSIDKLVLIMEKIIDEIKNDKTLVENAPNNASIGKLDEVKAVKTPNLVFNNLK